MSTGCDRCDYHNRPMLTKDGTLIDLSTDLHREVHDMVRSIMGGIEPFVVRLNRMLGGRHPA